MKELISTVNNGDVLTFKASDGKYKVIVCASVYKARSPHHFVFIGTDISQIVQPTLEDVLQSHFFGVANSKDDYLKYEPNELTQIWTFYPEIYPYHLGFYGFLIVRKDFMTFRDKFQLIGRLNTFDKVSINLNSAVNASNWGFLNNLFTENLEDKMKQQSQGKFKIKAILKQ
jgi:hypothetical protein